MCTYTYTLHTACMHKQYQNMMECVRTRTGDSTTRFGTYRTLHGELTLNRPVHLPEKEPFDIPLRECRARPRFATRPVSGLCVACKRAEKERRAAEALSKFLVLLYYLSLIVFFSSSFYQRCLSRS